MKVISVEIVVRCMFMAILTVITREGSEEVFYKGNSSHNTTLIIIREMTVGLAIGLIRQSSCVSVMVQVCAMALGVVVGCHIDVSIRPI
jgi:hypothetical protein